jgi:DNA polymerase-3 subunit alpha
LSARRSPMKMNCFIFWSLPATGGCNGSTSFFHPSHAKRFSPKTRWRWIFNNPWDGFVIYRSEKKPYSNCPNEKIGIGPKRWINYFPPARLSPKINRAPACQLQDKIHFNVHRLLRALIKIRSYQTRAGCDCFPGGSFIPPTTLINAFQQYPFIVTNTYRLIVLRADPGFR